MEVAKLSSSAARLVTGGTMLPAPATSAIIRYANVACDCDIRFVMWRAAATSATTMFVMWRSAATTRYEILLQSMLSVMVRLVLNAATLRLM